MQYFLFVKASDIFTFNQNIIIGLSSSKQIDNTYYINEKRMLFVIKTFYTYL